MIPTIIFFLKFVGDYFKEDIYDFRDLKYVKTIKLDSKGEVGYRTTAEKAVKGRRVEEGGQDLAEEVEAGGAGAPASRIRGGKVGAEPPAPAVAVGDSKASSLTSPRR